MNQELVTIYCNCSTPPGDTDTRVLSLFGSSIVSYLVLGLVLGIELVLDPGLGSLSILFIVRY
jgi:hypothetical protein